MKKTLILKILFTIFLSIAFSSSISAQKLFITKLHDLDFGEVFIGFSATVLDTDVNAAKFSFYHTEKKKKDLKISFVLPTTLDNAGGFQIPITFDQSQATWSKNDQMAGRANFDPHQQLKIKKVRKNDTHFIWLGGSIITTAGLPYGLYSGTIILTVAL